MVTIGALLTLWRLVLGCIERAVFPSRVLADMSFFEIVSIYVIGSISFQSFAEVQVIFRRVNKITIFK